MKSYLLVSALALSLSACNGVDRLINGKDNSPESIEQLIDTSAPLDAKAPEFNVRGPEGWERLVWYGKMPIDGKVSIQSGTRSVLKVFIKDTTIDRWFLLNNSYSEAFYYNASIKDGLVRYEGNIKDKHYCVYQYIPIDK